MSNIVEFAIKMKDVMSGGLSRLSSTSQSTFARMGRHINDVTGRNKTLSMSFSEIEKKIRDAENVIRNSTIPSQIREARRELASLQRLSSRHAGNTGGGATSKEGGLGSVFKGTLAAQFAMNAGSAFLGLVKDGIGGAISASMKKEQAIAGLSTFLGKEGATEAYKGIKQDAKSTTFDADSLLNANRALISAGMNAKDAREDAMNLANAISAVGGGNDELSRMAANMQQIKTVGKATSMDIRQFGMVGINIYEMLSRSTGKSIDQVKEMEVTYDQLAKALAMARDKGGLYEGALEAQSATMAGKLGTLKGVLADSLTDIGDAFSPIVNKFLDLGIKFAQNISPMLEQLQPYINAISDGLGQAIDYISNLTTGTGEWSDWIAIASEYFNQVWEFTKSIIVSVSKIIMGVAQWIAKSEIIKDVFRAIGWLLGNILDVIGWIGEKLVWLWENVLEPILSGIDEAYKFVKGWFSDEAGKTVTIDTKINPPDNLPKPPEDLSYHADLTRFKDTSIGAAEDKKKKNKTSEKKAGDTIAGGGPKVVNIHVGKFFDNIQFTTMNGAESAEQLEKITLECLARVLYNGAKTV